MWKWIKRRALIARHVTTSDAPTAERNEGSAPGRAAQVRSKYESLHDYLVNRYADSVVLTTLLIWVMLAPAAWAQSLTDAQVVAAIQAGANKRFSNLISDCVAKPEFREDLAASWTNWAGGLQFNNSFAVTVSRSAGRIAVMAAEAKRLYEPFGPADVPEGIRNNDDVYVVVFPNEPTSAGDSPSNVLVSSLIERVVLRSKWVSAVVQPASFATEPVSWQGLLGATVDGNRAYATFSLASVRELPPGDFDVVIVTRHGERRCKVGQRDRQRLFSNR